MSKERQQIGFAGVGRYLGTLFSSRRRLAHELSQTRKMLQLVLDAIPVRVHWKNRDSVYLGCNRRFARDAELTSPEEVVGKTDYDLPWKEYAELFRSRDRQVIESGQPMLDYEQQRCSSDGKVLCLRQSKLPLRDTAGSIIGVLSVYEDITKRKQSEMTLRESEARYRAVVENSADGIVVAVENKVAYVNSAAVRLAGAREARDLVGRGVLEFVHEAYRAEAEKRRAKMLETGQPSPLVEGKLRRPDGGIIDAEWIGVPIEYGGKSAILNSFWDITERKRAECWLAGEKRVLECIAKRKPLAEVLNEICGLIEELSPGVMSSILLVDADGTKLWPAAAPRLPEEWTRAITPLAIGPAVGSCGTAASEKAQIVVSDIASDPRWTAYPDYCAVALKCGLRACWSTPILTADQELLGTFAMYYAEPRTPRPQDLEVIRQVIHLASVAIEHERATEGLRRARDELEQRVRERTAELVRANERLEELDRLKSQFLATMSHELRTPLNSIIGFTGILRKGIAGPVNDEQKKQLGMVFGSAKHLLSLINDLLDLSRIEAGKVEVENEPFDFAEVIEEVVENLQPMAGQRNLKMAVELGEPAIKMSGDRKRCFQVLLNLANNAVKFTERGQVTISARTEGEALRVCVADTGVGIKPEQTGMLFEAFRQLDSSAKRVYEGTGLGLHLCRRLLTLMGGRIEVESQFGKGSRFCFTLPRDQVQDRTTCQGAEYEDLKRG